MLPGPGAHAPAEGSPAEARAGTGAGWSAEARRGRCHPPQGAGPTAAVRGGPGSGDGKVRRAGASPRTPRLAGLPHPTGLDKSHRSGRASHPPPALPASPPPGRDGPRPEIPRGLGASAGRGDAAA